MTNPLSIRTFLSDEWRTYRHLRLLSLAESPDSFGRTLEEERLRPDSEWEQRVISGARSALDLPLLAEVRACAAGLAWGKIEETSPHTASVYQMWVDPAHRRLRIGQQLLTAIITWATNAQARWLTLSVVSANAPAVSLYLGAGFVPDGPSEPLRPGSALLSQPMRLALVNP